MKNLLLPFLVVAASFHCSAQTDQIPLLNQRFIHPFNWVECGNNYYFLTLTFGASTNYLLTTTHAVEYTVHKYNKFTHQYLNSQVIAGDTSQADSIIYYFGPTLLVKEDKLHFVFAKQIPVNNSNHTHLYYTQLDTNLNVTVTERRVENDAAIQGFIPFNSDRTLLYYFKGDTMLQPGSKYSKYEIIDNAGNIVKEDTFEYKPQFVQGGYLQHRIVEVNPYPGDRYLVSGDNLLGNGKWMYLADANMDLIDTFSLKPTSFQSGTYSGFLLRYPNLISLPTGSLIGAGIFRTGINNWSIFTKHGEASRFSVDTSVVYDATDQDDEGHLNISGMHFLEYNEHDNRVYYADATHKDDFGSCDGTHSYVQVICADTNLHTKWRIYILHGPDSCAQVTKVSKPDGRSGVLVAGTTFNTSHPSDTAYTSHFVYYIDSTGGPLAVIGAPGVTVRERVMVFPNPAYDHISINDIEGKLKEAFVYNIRGSLVSRKVLNGKESRLYTGGLAPGLYMMKVVTTDGAYFQTKFVKE